MLPKEWLGKFDKGYLYFHAIPRDKELWTMDRFEDFVRERKALLNTILDQNLQGFIE
jgi:hypothetical protein